MNSFGLTRMRLKEFLFEPGLFLTLLLANMWTILIGITNLDMGSIWLLGQSLSTKDFQTGNYITVYGPLGFLDWNVWEYDKLLILSLTYRVLVVTCFYKVVMGVFSSKLNFIKSFFATNLFLGVLCSFMPPTFIFMIAIIYYFCNKILDKSVIKKSEIIALEICIASIFLIKMLYIQSLSVLLAFILYSRTKVLKRTIFHYLVAIFISVLRTFSFLSILLLILGFNTSAGVGWMRGYLELAFGYTAMISEEKGRIWEYFAFIVLVLMFYFIYRSKVELGFLLVIMVIFYLSFRYGFGRHDAHSIFTFLIVSSLAIFLNIKIESAHNKSFTGLAIITLISVSNLSFLNLISFTDRIQSSTYLLKMLDPRVRIDNNVNSDNLLLQQLNLSNEILSEIHQKKFTILPWPNAVPSFLRSNYVNAPVPSLFSAYTPWLDSKNSDWLASDNNSPQIILSKKLQTIDGRNAFWDSPNFQLNLRCNYHLINSDGEWFVFERNQKVVCNLNQSKHVRTSRNEMNFQIDDSFLYFINIKPQESWHEKLLTILFKPIYPDYVWINGFRFRLVPQTKNWLYIGSENNMLPLEWQIPNEVNIKFENNTKIDLYKVPIDRSLAG